MIYWNGVGCTRIAKLMHTVAYPTAVQGQQPEQIVYHLGRSVSISFVISRNRLPFPVVWDG